MIDQLMNDVSRACYGPIETASVYRWAEESLRLRDSPYGNQFKPDETPWLKEPLRCISDPTIETIVLNCAAQCGKTVSMQVASAWALANYPGPTMLVMQDESSTLDIAKQRMIPMIESCEALRKQFPEDRHMKTNTEIFFASATLKMGAANNNFLRSWSIRWMFGDECSAWKPGMMKRARARTVRYWNRKLWFSSTPEAFGDDFDLEYRSGTCEQWALKCQGCGELFIPDFYKCVKWETSDDTKPGGEWDFEKVAKSVRMECPHCQHSHENNESVWRLMVGQGGYIAQNQNPTPKVRSFSFNQLTLPPSVMPWASLVVDFLKAKRQAASGYLSPLKEFVTLRLAQPWKESEHIDTESIVAASYNPGAEWEDEAHRFMTIDCQQHLELFYVVIRAWAIGGASRLLTFKRCHSFDELRALQLEYKVADSKTFIDVGYETHSVLSEAAKYKWLGMRGTDLVDFQHVSGNGFVRRLYSKPTRVNPASGRISPPVFRWSNPSVKDILLMLRTGRSHPWEVCDLKDLADEYARQLDSERKREVQDKQGRVKLVWQRYRKDNHALDCECMNLVAASICKVFRDQD